MQHTLSNWCLWVKWANIWQKKSLNAFSFNKLLVFRLRFHWSVFHAIIMYFPHWLLGQSQYHHNLMQATQNAIKKLLWLYIPDRLVTLLNTLGKSSLKLAMTHTTNPIVCGSKWTCFLHRTPGLSPAISTGNSDVTCISSLPNASLFVFTKMVVIVFKK